MQGQTRWQDWANLIFGVWMLLSPAVIPDMACTMRSAAARASKLASTSA